VFAALTWLRRTRRRAAEAWARRRRDWRDWKSALRIESPSSSVLSSRALRIRTLSEQYRLEIGSWTICRRITRWSGHTDRGIHQGFQETVDFSATQLTAATQAGKQQSIVATYS